jgi:uncharacterized repeat protein (TIGR03987 family)
MLPVAIVSIISALLLYTIGVWSEKFAGVLNQTHLVFFWAGLVCDTLGTTLMGELARTFQYNLHGLTGAAAIVLMFAHTVWASAALFLKQESVLHGFHRFSLVVWGIWLVPFASGMVMAMAH